MAITNTALATAMSDLIAYWQDFHNEHREWLAGEVGGGPNSDGEYPLTDMDGNTVLVASPAKLEALIDSLVDGGTGAVGAAEAARDAALGAQTDAETAQGLAEAAEDNAVIAKGAAEVAQSAAESARATAIAQADIATIQAGLADTARIAAELAETNAEAAADSAEDDAIAAAASAMLAATFTPSLYAALADSDPFTANQVIDVGGGVVQTVNASGYAGLQVRPDAGAHGWVSFTEDGVADRWVVGIEDAADSLHFASGGVVSYTKRLSLSAAGLLANTYDNSAGAGMTMTNTSTHAAAVAQLTLFNDAGNYMYIKKLSAAGGGTSVLGTNGALDFHTSNTIKARFASTGQLMVGPGFGGDPGNPFGGPSLELGYATAFSSSFVLSYNRQSSTYAPLTLSASSLALAIGGDNRLTITSGGITQFNLPAGQDNYVSQVTTGLNNTVMGFNNQGSTNASGVLNNEAYLGSLNGYGVALVCNGGTGLRVSTTYQVTMPHYGAGSLTTNGSGLIISSSDERLKRDIESFEGGLEVIRGLSPISYRWTEESGVDDGMEWVGFSAQNVQQNLPEAVGTDPRGFLTLSDRPLLAALVNAIKELDARLGNLE